MADLAPDSLPPRYLAEGLLGRGGMGAVWAVRDRETGEALALKRFQPAAGADAEAGRFLFRQEYWAHATLLHPGLLAARAYGEDAAGPWYVMERAAGADLAAQLPQDEAALRAWLPGLVEALAFLHARGWVHGDLNPGNVRLLPDGRALLMDLGLLARAGRPVGAVRGTLAYVAPEVVRQGALDGRADWYALGAVLYHALAGRPPFEAGDAAGLLRAHLSEAPLPLRKRAPAVSAAFEAVVMRLLAKNPADRFADGAALLAALGVAAGEAGARLLSPPLVGREDVLARLAPGPGRFVVVGPAGSGKSRVLAELRAAAPLAGWEVLAAAGADGAPYAAVRPWLRAIVDGADAATLARLGPYVARLVPIDGIAPAEALEPAAERARFGAAIGELLAGLPPGRVWLLDDADRLDAGSREVLRAVLRGPAGGQVVLAAEGPVEGCEEVALLPIEVGAIAHGMLGAEPPAGLVDALAELAEGSPGVAGEALAHWVEAGVLRRGSGGWAVTGSLAVPGGAQALQAARFDALPADARALAALAALIGARGPLAALEAAAADAGSAAFHAALAALEDAGVLARDGEAFAFLRPARVPALAAQATAPAAAHARLVAWFGARAAAPDAPLDLLLAAARHAVAAAAPDAAAWALRAGQRAIQVHALAEATPIVEGALALGPDLGLLAQLAALQRIQGRVDDALALTRDELVPALRAARDPRLAEQLVTLALLHQLKGRYPEAAAHAAEALPLAEAAGDRVQVARARMFLGRVAFFTGNPDAALAHLAAGAAAADDEAPALRYWRALTLSFQGYLLATREPARADEALALIDRAIALNADLANVAATLEALNSQGNVLAALGRWAAARDVYAKHVALCERLGSDNERIFAHVGLGGALLELGDVAGARAQAEAGALLAARQQRRFPESYALALGGRAAIDAGEPAAGLARVRAGVALAVEIGNRYAELCARTYEADALAALGRYAAARAAWGAAAAIAEETKNDELAPKLTAIDRKLTLAEDPAAADLAGWIHEAEASARPGAALPWRLAAARFADDPLPEALAVAAEAEALGLGRVAAEAHLLAGQTLGSRSATWAERGAADPTAAPLSGATPRPEAHLAAARDRAAADGNVWLELAAAHALADLHQDQTTLDTLRARFRDLTRDLTPIERAALPCALPADDPAVGASRVAHLTRLLAALAASADLPAVMAQALEALVELADADRGLLALYDGYRQTERLTYGPDADDDFSTTLLRRALWTGEPVVVDDVAADAELAAQASVQALALRTAIALPLRHGDQVTGVMLADSARLGTGWPPADLAIATALAQAVALAIGHARQARADAEAQATQDALLAFWRAAYRAPDLAALGQAALAQALATTGAERGLLLHPDLTAAAAWPPGAPAEPSTSVARWVLDQGEPLHMVDVQADDAFQAARSVMALGLRTVHAVPVVRDAATLGLLYLDAQRLIPEDPAAMARLQALAAALAEAWPAG